MFVIVLLDLDRSITVIYLNIPYGMKRSCLFQFIVSLDTELHSLVTSHQVSVDVGSRNGDHECDCYCPDRI